MMRNGFYGPGDGGGIFLLLFVIFVAAVVWIVVSSLDHRGHHHGPGCEVPGPGRPAHRGPDDDPMAILDRRFARGEIDEDEYLRRRKVLRGD